MANNRAYLYCPVCKQGQFLAKTTGPDWSSTPHEPEALGEHVIDFLTDHFVCGVASYESTHVELRFEHHEDRARELPVGTEASRPPNFREPS